MNDSELVDEARRWLRFATEDLDVAQRLLAGDGTPPRHACALAQQAAEKALKAALVLEGIDFPFRHDLDALRNLLPDTWSVRCTHTDLAQLTEWAVEARYQAIGKRPQQPMPNRRCRRHEGFTTR